MHPGQGGRGVEHEFGRDEQFDILADLTAMLTLALADERDGLERFIDGLQYSVETLRFVLYSSVVLYGEAFARWSECAGVDPLVMTQGIALREAQARWQS
jgi:hypothetical protein